MPLPPPLGFVCIHKFTKASWERLVKAGWGHMSLSLLLRVLGTFHAGRKGTLDRSRRKENVQSARRVPMATEHEGAACGWQVVAQSPLEPEGLSGKPGHEAALATAQLEPRRWLSSVAGDQPCKRGAALVPKRFTSTQDGSEPRSQ